MRHLLSRENAELLEQLAWSKVLLAFDFDGTLAPIVDNRDDAQMRDRTFSLFEKVCRAYPCAVISGRSYADVSARLLRLPVRYIVGNHGLEPSDCLQDFQKQVAQARLLLTTALTDCAGIDIEDKRYSLAVHYRRSRNKRSTRQAIADAVSDLPIRMRIVAGKLVMNVIPEHAKNKGDALIELRNKEEADTALFVGDDVTDEDVFELDQPGRLLTVRIGESKRSAAAYFLRDQREIDKLLARLATLRTTQLSR